MPLFERGYKAAAKTELERDIRRIEEKDKKAQTELDKLEFNRSADALYSNLNFAERLNLISVEQGIAYRERVAKATLEFYHLQKTEFEEIVDNFENPRERTERYMDMDEVQAKIAQERADASSEQAQTNHVHSSPSKEVEEERKR